MYSGAGAQNSGDSDHCDWVVVEPGRSVTGLGYNTDMNLDFQPLCHSGSHG